MRIINEKNFICCKEILDGYNSLSLLKPITNIQNETTSSNHVCGYRQRCR